MRTVSFQGSQITASDRVQIARREQIARSLFLNRVLSDQVAQIIASLDQRKEQRVKPEKIWSLDFQSKGTPFVGDVFGFGHFIEV